MLHVLAAVVLVLAAGAGVLLAVAASRPDSFHVGRSTSVMAPPEAIFRLVNDLRAFNTWNPFVAGTPDATLVYRGPQAGPGATVAFGPGRSGTGTLAITQATPTSQVIMHLDMERPLGAHNRIEFTLQPEGAATRVTWTMQGGVPLLGKVVHLLIDMDSMVGRQFEKGLSDLKAIAES